MVVLEVIFLLSKILIDPSVVKIFPYYLFYMENICFIVSFISFFIDLGFEIIERSFMELKQNNMTSNYFSEEYLMNTVSRFWKNFVAEEFYIKYGIGCAGECGCGDTGFRKAKL